MLPWDFLFPLSQAAFAAKTLVVAGPCNGSSRRLGGLRRISTSSRFWKATANATLLLLFPLQKNSSLYF